ncbi:hypothetical protein DKZ22_07415 [Limosilactobacillus reuteri]|uniref:Uncharacterized protein n=1 Tax=Limosilactobacillus reuteri TaxID=1598 RepID=A0A855XW91_LIMRT|nr:hypothetical protein [Limosilactobacillus reuteri]PWT35170.1 hypothetical protein DKZ24_04920 [Limosilactobacillus reuteri]PWT40992.1 hypothetical protein DKZ22_07415 [Limosilactobacillus reuteri]PWT53813.1 hypothetical protein DKZ31_07535 [Limosilactobacillus reuteri]PWT59788.1 hypothetical protein DKZ30_04875 [Limosilactobacillus reuteri]PWT64489.1 hypothetical protein DKZ20_04960 [Limosilactobacillus reuteri]
MAQRRMISKSIHQDGRFLTLSPASKILYDDLVLYADDDGFCSDVSLINLMDKATAENYSELEQAGLIVNVEGVYLIVDWLNTQLLNHYSRTSFLDLSSKVFIRIDFKYTINAEDRNIALPLDDWVERKNRNRKINLKALQQQRLKGVVTQKVTNGKSNVSKKITKGSPSIDKNSIDKSRLEQNRPDQIKKEKINKENNYKYINSSSNGGMGEILLNDDSSTSSIENNATTENGENSRANSGVNQDAVSSLFNYLNGISPTDIPKDNKRLADVFDMLIHNGYEIEDIQLGIDNIMNVANQMPQYQNEQSLAKLLIQHLPEYTKQTVEQSSSND